jgi:hypothetical protein
VFLAARNCDAGPRFGRTPTALCTPVVCCSVVCSPFVVGLRGAPSHSVDARLLAAVKRVFDRPLLSGLGCLMSQGTALAIDRADASDAFASTRANYERFAFLLLRAGHVPGLALTHLDFRVLIFLLGQKPGHYAAHQHTIAKACDSNTTSIRKALMRLRASGLVLWKLIPPHHTLPSGRFARTNVNRYWVHLPRLAALVGIPSRPALALPKATASTQPKPGASSGTEIPKEQKPPPTTPPPAPRAPCALQPPQVEGVSPTGLKFASLRHAWERLGLGVLDDRSLRTLENRTAEGATPDQLEAAVVGASVDEWLRRRAKVPFAVVFASLASIERFAHEGRKILDRHPTESGPPSPEREEGAHLFPRPSSAAAPINPSAETLPLRRRGPPQVLSSVAPRTVGHCHRRIRDGRPPELSRLLEMFTGAVPIPSDPRRQETPQSRRLREQAEFDQRRLELVATLRSLEQ